MRHPEVVSSLSDFSKGLFKPVLDDSSPPDKPRKIIFCSGKIYYELLARRRELKSNSAVLVRIEQYYPLPKQQLEKVVNRYDGVKGFCWVQEEPENMGAWQFLRPQLEGLIGKSVGYIGRNTAASPAPGIPGIYRRQQNEIVDKAIGSYYGNRS
jgi:2-oxoglutarate dehydrogenase E1 component